MALAIEELKPSYRLAVDKFLVHRRNSGFITSENSMTWYKYGLKTLVDWMDNNGLIPATTNYEHLEDYKTFLQEEKNGWSKKTIHGKLTACKTLFKWMHQRAYISTNPAADLDKVKLPDVLVEFLTEEQMDALLDQVSTLSWCGMRMRTMIILAADTGLRLGEMLNLKWEYLDMDQQLIKVVDAKCDKERYVPFGKTCRKALEEYLDRRGNMKTDDYVLVDEWGTQCCDRALQKSLRNMGVKCGIPKLHWHMLRHTFATQWIRSAVTQNGADNVNLFALQSMLGHSTLAMVQRYAHTCPESVRMAHSQHSPMDTVFTSVKVNGNGKKGAKKLS